MVSELKSPREVKFPLETDYTVKKLDNQLQEPFQNSGKTLGATVVAKPPGN